MAFSQLLITQPAHPRGPPSREAICEFGFNGNDLKATVYTPEAQKQVDKRPVPKPVWSVHTGEFKVS